MSEPKVYGSIDDLRKAAAVSVGFEETGVGTVASGIGTVASGISKAPQQSFDLADMKWFDPAKAEQSAKLTLSSLSETLGWQPIDVNGIGKPEI
jgi:hypothetical protein